jgi:hypothetical protein
MVFHFLVRDTHLDILFYNAKVDHGPCLVFGYARVNKNIMEITFKVKIVNIHFQEPFWNVDHCIGNNYQLCKPFLESLCVLNLDSWFLGLLEG